MTAERSLTLGVSDDLGKSPCDLGPTAAGNMGMVAMELGTCLSEASARDMILGEHDHFRPSVRILTLGWTLTTMSPSNSPSP